MNNLLDLLDQMLSGVNISVFFIVVMLIFFTLIIFPLIMLASNKIKNSVILIFVTISCYTLSLLIVPVMYVTVGANSSCELKHAVISVTINNEVVTKNSNVLLCYHRNNFGEDFNKTDYSYRFLNFVDIFE